jgi:NAD(P)-dependent dehydrogenase (short-subunit alcohol dehydrogenase family)
VERQAGSIVVTSSINGLEAGDHYTHYSSAKHGVIGLMKNMALELAPHGVRCNAICPGATDTAMATSQEAYDMFAGHAGGTREEMLEAGYHFNALKGTTWLDPQYMADAALFLNSDLAVAITGVTVPVDGGHLILPGYNHAPVK